MKKDPEIHEEAIVRCIEANNLFTLEMIFSFYKGIGKTTFYELDLNKSDRVLKALEDNKIITKQNLLSRWQKGDNATLQIALFKIIATPDEHSRLTANKTEHSGSVEIKPITGMVIK
jgi:hypothetical protein